MIWNMRLRKKKVFTVTLSGNFYKRTDTTERAAELYVTINGEDCTDEGIYEVAPDTVISVYAKTQGNKFTEPGIIRLNGEKVNKTNTYGLKVTGNVIIKGTIKSVVKQAIADITMPA